MSTPPVTVDPVQTLIYTSRLGSFIGDVNLTPDFPTAAKTAKTMWEERYDSKIDGVVAIDPVVLAHILEATGPIAVPVSNDLQVSGGIAGVLTAQNAVQTLLSDVYKNIADNTTQDEYFSMASAKIFEALASGKASASKLWNPLSKSVAENRIYVWSDSRSGAASPWTT